MKRERFSDEQIISILKEYKAGARVPDLARTQRVSYTNTLKARGVKGKGYMRCTEAVYAELLGGEAWQVRENRKLPWESDLRDNFDISKLSYVMTAEALAPLRVDDKDCQGVSISRRPQAAALNSFGKPSKELAATDRSAFSEKDLLIKLQ